MLYEHCTDEEWNTAAGGYRCRAICTGQHLLHTLRQSGNTNAVLLPPGYVRWSITLILFKGGDLGNFTHGVDDDEALISQRFPEAAGRHCAAVGPALAVHYSYYTQRPGLGSQPEVLATYTRIAEETCGSLVG